MKRILLAFATLCAITLQAQEKASYNDTDKITFFGIDFSMVKVYGAPEDPIQFKMIFRELNNLFLSEAAKYDPAKYLGKKEATIQLETVNELSQKVNGNDLKVFNKTYHVSESQIKDFIRSFDTKGATGYGAIMLCTFMDRNKHRATYDIVTFDIDTKEVIRIKRVEAKAAGNSFQNYWAASILNALKVALK